MAEQNGNSRLDRIERALDLLIADHERFREHHEQFREEHKALLRAQVVQQDQLDKLAAIVAEHSRQIERNSREIARRSEELEALGRQTDARIEALGRQTDARIEALGRKTDARIEALVSAIAKLVPPGAVQ